MLISASSSTPRVEISVPPAAGAGRSRKSRPGRAFGRDHSPASWLQAGQALARVLLRVTELGLAASPLGQTLDLPWTRHRVGLELGLAGHPQMVLRVGHARVPGGRSPRRPLSEILGT